MFEFKLDVPKDQPIVGVRTTDKRGFTPEELAEQCVKHHLGLRQRPSGHRDQARAFQKHIEMLVANYMRQAIRSDRTTVYNALTDAGHPELAELIRRL
jgi:hypothetical protein